MRICTLVYLCRHPKVIFILKAKVRETDTIGALWGGRSCEQIYRLIHGSAPETRISRCFLSCHQSRERSTGHRRRRAGGRDALGAGAGKDQFGVRGLRSSPPTGSVDRGDSLPAAPDQTPSLAHVFLERNRSAAHLLTATRRHGYRLVEIAAHFGVHDATVNR